MRLLEVGQGTLIGIERKEAGTSEDFSVDPKIPAENSSLAVFRLLKDFLPARAAAEALASALLVVETGMLVGILDKLIFFFF
jgi:hypothetical protein